jgi:putative membrane protein
MHWQRPVISVALLGVCLSWAQATEPRQTRSSEQQARPISPDTFVTQATAAWLAERGFSQLASTQAISNGLRKFIQQVTSDDKKLAKDLRTIAKTKHIPIAKDLDQDHREREKRLVGLSGSSFEQKYVEEQLGDTKAMVALYESYSQNGTDADLKALAAQDLPTLKHRLSLIKDLASKGIHSH